MKSRAMKLPLLDFVLLSFDMSEWRKLLEAQKSGLFEFMDTVLRGIVSSVLYETMNKCKAFWPLQRLIYSVSKRTLKQLYIRVKFNQTV